MYTGFEKQTNLSEMFVVTHAHINIWGSKLPINANAKRKGRVWVKT